MPERNKDTNGHMNHCPDCGMHYGYYHHHFFLRWLIGIIILLIVFWLGMKIGEFKGYFGDDGYDWRMMGQGRYNMMYWYNSQQQTQPQTQIPPSTKAPTTKK